MIAYMVFLRELAKWLLFQRCSWLKKHNFHKGSHFIPMGEQNRKLMVKKINFSVSQRQSNVLEDTITTGMSLLETLDKLIDSGIEVVAALSLTDRMEKRDDGKSVRETIKTDMTEKSYYAMSAADKLLPVALERTEPSQQVKDSLVAEFNKYGVQPLELGGSRMNSFKTMVRYCKEKTSMYIDPAEFGKDRNGHLRMVKVK